MFIFVFAIVTQDSLYQELESSSSAFQNYLDGVYPLSAPYKIKAVDLSKTYIKFRIDPCKGKANQLCCEGMNEGLCQDNPVTFSGPNLLFAWSCNNIVVSCGGDFYDTEVCGTFIEIHQPNSTEIINYLKVSLLYMSGFHTESIYTRNQIPGKYELWWVQRDRNRRWVLYVKPFYIAY